MWVPVLESRAVNQRQSPDVHRTPLGKTAWDGPGPGKGANRRPRKSSHPRDFLCRTIRTPKGSSLSPHHLSRGLVNDHFRAGGRRLQLIVRLLYGRHPPGINSIYSAAGLLLLHTLLKFKGQRTSSVVY